MGTAHLPASLLGRSKRVWQTLPLRRRLSLLIAACAGITALLSLLAVLGSGLWLQKDRAREEASEVVRTLSFALHAPVAFSDRKGIDDALTLLRARPQVSGAWVYDARGGLLASYGDAAPVAPSEAMTGVGAGYLLATEAIRSDAQVVGQVVIANRESRLWQSLALAIFAIVVASTAGLVLSVRLAQRIAAAITQPIDTLAEASRAIARSHDYTRRLPAGGSDEIGTAITAFNDMLDEIRKRGDALGEANRELERRVDDRTRSLQMEKERAEAASVAKTRFLANMSHELRTPLNAVIGAAQLLQDGSGRDDQALLVSAIRGSGSNLLGLIDNILDLTRIETGALELVPEDFNLIDCFEAALSTASVAARVKGLELACIVEPGLPTWCHGDPTRLRQIVLNLLGNAVKFTLQGEVVLHAEAGAAPGTIEISVSDTGIGIGAASLAQVFEPFRQADDASNRRFGGSGLGLAISRQLVGLMEGRIEVTSTLGRGSRFVVTLALAAARAVHPVTPPMRRKVVFFEPHEASARALASQLVRLGCEAVRCQTPRELRECLARYAEAREDPWLFAAVDDAEAWALLEEAIAAWPPARVVGMATSESPAAEGIRRRLGVGRNLIKPVLRSALVSRLGEAADPRAVRLPVVATPRTAAQTIASTKHVLVVEDDPTNQMIVCHMLHKAGYLTSIANNGTEALALLSEQAFDVVLMDWQMPDLDGLEVTRRLRRGDAGRFAQVVPIIALTANAFSEDRIACLQAGMNDFLTKPILGAHLTAAVQRWTHRPGGDEESTRTSAFAPLV